MILFDHQTFIFQKYGGISRMFSEIMKYLHEHNVEFQLPIICSDNANLTGKPFYKPTSPNFTKEIPDIEDWLIRGAFPGKGRAYSIARMFYDRKKKRLHPENKSLVLEVLKKLPVKVFHPTYFDDYFLDTVSRTKKPFIITVYDLIHEKFMGYFSKEDLVLKNRRELCRRAEHIIAISESTKKDLMEIYNIEPEKISVIHLASSLKTASSVPIRDSFLKDYILFVGDRWYYKNFTQFLYSVEKIIKKHKIMVVCAGSRPFTKEETGFMDSLGILGKVVQIPVADDGNLAWLYSNARLFVFPSMYEGFGIPILEAMSMNCPVVCSSTSSFPEVAGDAAETFDPWDTESMKYAIETVFESDVKRNRLIKQGAVQAEKFSWEKTNQAHMSLYKKF